MSNKNTFEGTTTVGITCKDGVVFASERRASMGNLVAHKVAEKIFKIDNHIAATIAGSVADAQTLMKVISAETSLYRLRNGKDISLEAAAAVSSNILHSSPAYVQTLIGGVDDTGASIYSLDAAGGMIKDTFISTGSGSTFAYGVLEDRFYEDITVEEATEVAIRAIKAATERDTFSGNGFLVANVTKDGFKMLEKEEVDAIIEKINS
ncbi:proteasome beta subunit [Methanobrevibacter ruminantium M1]|uniref:Proteasome subunit beta n=1 Tax=Methanobrevibacter ruminantium (strain ATCC 35063 / DSM 1093 / JCM 13430 / OCM 146 / M1) TaxID=634498 RepID=PSB_METRM|nr:archaeal proteasome endopeptidase complex subunit beta [Methanobrevibacter ruminantium]D3E0A3.1 RecName: Full=Proteasome subunit beta; AltName: Full=20S proteasome beta subunit; AltName: Full=Proteasome core protein PsmB; Flags: Precursor [Methanobrevibacter ruminantium M1]ADC47827.1 proteasome beta subunit [Methanobrevibacter ruminantium M1]